MAYEFVDHTLALQAEPNVEYFDSAPALSGEEGLTATSFGEATSQATDDGSGTEFDIFGASGSPDAELASSSNDITGPQPAAFGDDGGDGGDGGELPPITVTGTRDKGGDDGDDTGGIPDGGGGGGTGGGAGHDGQHNILHTYVRADINHDGQSDPGIWRDNETGEYYYRPDESEYTIYEITDIEMGVTTTSPSGSVSLGMTLDVPNATLTYNTGNTQTSYTFHWDPDHPHYVQRGS